MAVNPLEESLEKAATDAGERANFLRKLMESEIYLIPALHEQGAEKSGLALQPWQLQLGETPQAVLPFFSSLENLEEFRQHLPEQEKYTNVCIGCRDFFENSTGFPASIVLNPGLQYGKDFSVNEIAKLLDGSLLAATPTPPEKAGGEFMIGEPTEYPTKLVDALKVLFGREESNVQAAYLAHVFYRESGEPPHSCVGIQTISNQKENEKEGDRFQSVLLDAIHIQEEVSPDKIVDFVEVKEGSEGEVEQYMLTKSEPFFLRGN